MLKSRITITTLLLLLGWLYLATLSCSTATGGSESVPESAGQSEPMRRMMPGSYAAIPNLHEDERVQSVARFAVAQASSSRFSFPKTTMTNVKPMVVRGYQQVVAGLNYKLVIVLVNTDQQEQDHTPTTTSELQNVVGGFGVTVYDHFGELTVSKWGKELSREQAISLLENTQEFGEEAMNRFDE